MAQSVSSTFAARLSAMFFILAFFTNTLAKEEKKLVPKGSLARYRLKRNRDLIMGLLFAALILPFLWGDDGFPDNIGILINEAHRNTGGVI